MLKLDRTISISEVDVNYESSYKFAVEEASDENPLKGPF